MFRTSLRWLRRHFIPHRKNHYRPHFLRGRNARAVVAVIIALELVVFVAPTLNFAHIVDRLGLASVLPGVLDALANEERTGQELTLLQPDPLLAKAAQMKAEDMAEKGYFAHTSPEGLTPWHWLEEVGYSYDYAGENLAINFSDSKDVVDAWMNSPTHRANLLKEPYRRIGTGMAVGMYEGKETVFIAQVYANPRTIVPDAPSETRKFAEEVTPAEESLAVQDSSPTVVLGTTTSAEEQEAEVATVQAPSFVEKAAASPRHTFNLVLMFFAGVIALALALNFFISINRQHPDLVTNGLAVVAVIGLIFIGNGYLSTGDIEASQSSSYEYANPSP